VRGWLLLLVLLPVVVVRSPADKDLLRARPWLVAAAAVAHLLLLLCCLLVPL
jgi:cytochrome b561